MKKIKLSFLALIVTVSLYSQTLLNGDFEKNTAGVCLFNLSNNFFTQTMKNSFAFGFENEIDIQDTACGYSNPEHGKWFISLATNPTSLETDGLSLSLDKPFIRGNSYQISYYEKADTTFHTHTIDSLLIGISSDSAIFGTRIFSSQPFPQIGWAHKNFTFQAPLTGKYLTIQNKGAKFGWNFIDNFQMLSPVPRAFSNSPICIGDTLKLFASEIPGAAYIWMGPNHFPSDLQNPFIPNVTITSTGIYWLTTVVNDIPSLPDSIYISIATPVVINPAFHIQSQCIDSSMSFTLNPASGTSPFSYQWLHNGTSISGATTINYQLSTINYADSGKYSCVISNICNSVTGNVMSLTPVECVRYRHKINGYVTYDNKSLTPLSSKFDSTVTNVYLYNSGDTLIGKTQTDDYGYYEFVNIINGSYYLTGSTKKAWGGSNPTDALIVNRNYIGMHNFSDSLLWHAGDVDSNNRLNPTDALIINRRYIGLINKYPKVGDWKFQKMKVEMVGENLTQDIKAICSGDVNASYAPYLIPQKILYTPINTIGSLYINPNPNPGPSPFDIPVYLNDNIDLGAIGLKVETQGFASLKIIGIKSDLSGLIYNITNDGIDLAWAAIGDGMNVIPDKPLFDITVIYNAQPNSPFSNWGRVGYGVFQLSSESEITDININPISTDKLFIPQLNFSILNSQFSINNYPNPFNNITNIEYTLPENLKVNLTVYNVLGEKVTTLVNTNQPPGQYTIKYDASNLRQGIYYCKLEATNSNSAFSKTNIMMLTR